MMAEFLSLKPLDYGGNEAINTLCTNLSFTGLDTKIVMLTSSQPSEGKTFISVNLMRAMSQLGKKVVLVDADLRKSVLNARFNVRLPHGSKGLTHYLAGMCHYEEILYDTNFHNAFYVPVGRTVGNSLALLNNPLLGKLLRQLASESDYVFVDAPPVGAVIDAAEIAKSCDGALFVVNYNQVRRRELLEAKEQIQMSGCPVLGAVLNQVDFDSLRNKKYYSYHKYYGNYNETNSAIRPEVPPEVRPDLNSNPPLRRIKN